MNKRYLSGVVNNCKKNKWLLFSSIAALCLFFSPSLNSLKSTAVIFAAVVVATFFDVAKPSVTLIQKARLGSFLLTALISCVGFYTFYTTWSPSSKVAVLAGSVGLTTPVFLLAVGFIGCAVGLYAIYVLACWIILWYTKLIKNQLPVQERNQIIENLKQNWYFPISAMAFFCLYLSLTFDFWAALMVAFAASLIFASQIPLFLSYSKTSYKGTKIVSLFTAIGVCWAGKLYFDTTWSGSSKVQELEAFFPVAIDLPEVVGIFGAIAALYFIYYCVLIFWNSITKIISESQIFSGVTPVEWIIYGLLFAASIGLIFFAFVQSEAFYGTAQLYDIIYTSDTPILVKDNVYLTLTHPQNDLRQPLFAVFAAPFIGIPYFLARLFDTSASVQAMLVNSAQILLLFTTNFILAKMLKLDSVKRIYFMLLTSCTYTQLLFTLMMEQYIIAYFWLAFCLYLISEKQRPARIVLWGAGSTLLTSMILLPFMSDKSPIQDFRAWFADMVKYGLEFVALMLAFCRFDVILNLMSSIYFLGAFTGKTVTFVDKIYQYTEFLGNCFIAPNASVGTNMFAYASWQLDAVTGINFLGVLFLILAVVSAIWNRDKKSSLLAAGWIGFSVVMLLGLGWGTKENGLILYALYFGWAFLVLLFQLVEKIESELNVRFLLPIFTLCTTAVLLVINIPAIMEIVNFAITYYPA